MCRRLCGWNDSISMIHRRSFPSFAVLVLIVLHNDVWNRHSDAVLLGWIPFDLAYHVAWVGLGTAVLHLVLRATWGDES